MGADRAEMAQDGTFPVIEHRRIYQEGASMALKKGEQAFQNYFCHAPTLRQTICRGYWDLTVHILTPMVVAHIEKPENLRILEIGYGGGRILNATCGFFGHVYGLDIHNESTEVERFLKEMGRDNFTLIQGDGNNIPLPDESLDLVYSFITFIHLAGIDQFRDYVVESYRVLKPGGIIHFYYGKIDDGYRERRTNANESSLTMSEPVTEIILRQARFKIIDRGQSFKTAPDGFPLKKGWQGYLTGLR